MAKQIYKGGIAQIEKGVGDRNTGNFNNLGLYKFIQLDYIGY